MDVKTFATAKPGVYTGNFTVSACADVVCAVPLPGAPFKLPYSVEVMTPEGGVQAFNQSALTALVGAPDWETFQANAQHTGHVPVSLNPSAFSLRWQMRRQPLMVSGATCPRLPPVAGGCM